MLGAPILALAALAMQAEAEPKRLPPVDRCREAGFTDFRAQLRSVIAAKDEDKLLAMLADDVRTDIGGARGRAAFAAAWALDLREESRVWDELRKALAFGCTAYGAALVSPPFVAQIPAGLNPFDTVIAIPLTRLRTAKSNFAPGLGNLDWHIATVTDPSDPLWIGVSLLDGRRGYIRRNQVISLIERKLTFEKRDGQWVIAGFLAEG